MSDQTHRQFSKVLNLQLYRNLVKLGSNLGSKVTNGTTTLHTRHCGQEWADLDAAGQRGHSDVQRAASCTTCKSRDTHSNTLVSSTFSFADFAVTIGYSVDGAADDGINTRDKVSG